jgi:zinc protease
MIERYTLKNGIPVFIVENHASPVVSIQAWVKRGSVHEVSEVAGISHFLEHALFKGTRRRRVGEIALEIERHGGEINAFTSFEETAYYTTIASRYFEQGLDIIADAIQNPLFDSGEMAREREVILEEIKRAYDSPSRVVSMNLWKTMFAGTPYGRPVLGFEETVRKINHTKLRSYFSKNYHAGTTSLFIVGDVDRKKVLAKIEAKLSKMKRVGPKKRETQIKYNSPKRGDGVSVLLASKDVSECHVQVGFMTPAITDSKIPALDLFCSALGQGESSRLYQYLVKEKKLALEAHLGLAATAHCGMMVLSLVTAPENTLAAIREGLALFEKIAVTGLNEDEIERVKTSLEAEIAYGKETVESYARRLGYYFIQFGDPDYENKYLHSLLAVTKEETLEAFREILIARPVVSAVHPLNYSLDKTSIAKLFKKGSASGSPIRGKTAPSNGHAILPELHHRGLLRFVTKKVDALPMVASRLIFLGGSRVEDPARLGMGNLFQRVWTSGTKTYDSLQIAKTLEALGASVHSFCGKNTFGLSIECLSKHWPVVKPLITEILLSPTFPETEFETEKELTLREILSERDSPAQLCNLNFMSGLYGKHPYGRSSSGTKETVEKLTTSDLKEYYKNFINQKSLVLSAVGNFDPASWTADWESLLTKLPQSGKSIADNEPIKRKENVHVIVERKEPLFQSHMLVGFLGASFNDDERYALKVLSSCLAGQGGRLFLELRDKQSLAYSVSPINSDSPDAGVFGFYIGCSTEKLITALKGIRIELSKILDKPILAKELSRAKEYWVGRFELEMQRYSAQSMLYGLDEIYGLGYRQSIEAPKVVKALTGEDIQRAAQKFLKPELATISIVHNVELDPEVIRREWLSV